MQRRAESIGGRRAVGQQVDAFAGDDRELSHERALRKLAGEERLANATLSFDEDERAAPAMRPLAARENLRKRPVAMDELRAEEIGGLHRWRSRAPRTIDFRPQRGQHRGDVFGVSNSRLGMLLEQTGK
jgi:hypothetical protein